MDYTISTDTLPDASELKMLFTQTTWAKNRTLEGINLLLRDCSIYVAVRAGNQLIGFGRAMSDGVYRALLEDIVVHEDYRKQGIGGLIVKTLMEKLEGIEEVFLHTRTHLEPFYEQHGFKKATSLTMKH